MRRLFAILAGVLSFVLLMPFYQGLVQCPESEPCPVVGYPSVIGFIYPGTLPFVVPMLIAVLAGVMVALALWRTWAKD
jgi:hypothetical protein